MPRQGLVVQGLAGKDFLGTARARSGLVSRGGPRHG